MELEDYIEQLAKTREGLAELVQEAHMLKRELKDSIEVMRSIKKGIEADITEFKNTLNERMDDKCTELFDEYDELFNKQIELTTAAIDRRFQTIVDIMLGEDKKARKQGKKTMEELVRAHMDGKILLIEKEAGDTILAKRQGMLPPGLRRK